MGFYRRKIIIVTETLIASESPDKRKTLSSQDSLIKRRSSIARAFTQVESKMPSFEIVLLLGSIGDRQIA
jgi:hypothetical protein